MKVNTPAGALAIRGGNFLGNAQGSRDTFLFLYGDEMRLTRPDRAVLRAFEAGYKIDTSSGIGPVTPLDVRFFMQAFSKGAVKEAGTKERRGCAPPAGQQHRSRDQKRRGYSRILGDIFKTPVADTPGTFDLKSRRKMGGHHHYPQVQARLTDEVPAVYRDVAPIAPTRGLTAKGSVASRYRDRLSSLLTKPTRPLSAAPPGLQVSTSATPVACPGYSPAPRWQTAPPKTGPGEKTSLQREQGSLDGEAAAGSALSA